MSAVDLCLVAGAVAIVIALFLGAEEMRSRANDPLPPPESDSSEWDSEEEWW